MKKGEMALPRAAHSEGAKAVRSGQRVQRRRSARGGKGPRTSGSRRPALFAMLLGIVLVAAGLWWTCRRTPTTSPGRAPDSAPPESLYAQAIRLGNEGRNLESLSLFERAGPGLAGRHWEYHFDYAATLHNLCIQGEERRGIRMPAVRTSVERVALMRRALAELERAERVATTPRDKSRVFRIRAQILRFWGLPWDTFEQLRLAQYADRSQDELARDANAYMRLLQNPRPAAP